MEYNSWGAVMPFSAYEVLWHARFGEKTDHPRPGKIGQNFDNFHRSEIRAKDNFETLDLGFFYEILKVGRSYAFHCLQENLARKISPENLPHSAGSNRIKFR